MPEKRFARNKIVIWGLRKKYHTHRYIHKAFFENAKKLSFNVVWVEDEKKHASIIEEGDLVISSEVQGKMVKEKKTFEDYNLPIKKGVYYCLHNYREPFTKNLDPDYFIILQTYSNGAEKSDQKWGPATFFDSKSHVLYQPWGTNLLPSEFKKPVFNRNNLVFWIGSVWNNIRNQGNTSAIQVLKEVLAKHGVRFIPLRFIPERLSILLVRMSRLAPAISGDFQVEVNYLPCRMFKNISWGQLGFSNVKKFEEIFTGCNIYSGSIEKTVEKALGLSEKEYKDIILQQQAIVKNYTYEAAYENIFRAFETIGKIIGREK